MTEELYDHFIDAFGNRVELGDEVVYVLGDRSSKRLVKGVLEKVGYNEDRYFNRTRYYIKPTQDSEKHWRSKEGSLSPMEDSKRIMKI